MPILLALSAVLSVGIADPALAALTAPVPAATAVNPLSREPFYADIVRRASALRDELQRARAPGAPALDLVRLKTEVDTLSDLDMQGHLDLAKRGKDGDLKCILRGISQDLVKKLDELQAAVAPAARATALEDMYYLLRDNVEVITTQPSVQS